MKNLLIGLVVLLLIFFGIFYILVNDTSDQVETSTSTSDNTEEEPTSNVDSNEEVNLPTDFRLHGEPDNGYSIALPFAVDVSSPQSGITRYRYLGPNNVPNSEITDGYTITISARSAVATSVEALAAQEIQGERDMVLKAPTTDSLADERVSRYTTESELGNKPIENYVFLPENGFEYVISVNISPSNNNAYQQDITEILETLNFLNERESSELRSRIVPIAMLDYEAVGENYIKESGGEMQGCDRVVTINHVLAEATTTPLNASLSQLFMYRTDTVAGWQNFIANQRNTLSFERAEITGETAHIYLTGELDSLAGVCDNPRTAIQVEETALAYSTVNAVELYLNGEATDLIPNGRGD